MFYPCAMLMQASSAGGVPIYGRTPIWHSTLAMFLVTWCNMRFFLHVNVQYILITYLICISYLWVRVFWLTLIRSSAVCESQGRRHYNDNEAHFNPPSILQFLMWWFFRHYSCFFGISGCLPVPQTLLFLLKKIGHPNSDTFPYWVIYWFISLAHFKFQSPNNIIIYIYIYWQCLTSSSPYYLYAILNCQSTDIRPSSPSRWTWLVSRSSPNGRFDIWGFLGLFSMINVIRPYLLVGLQWVSPTPVSFKP